MRSTWLALAGLVIAPVVYAADFTITIPDDKLPRLCTSMGWTEELKDDQDRPIPCPRFLKLILQQQLISAYLAPEITAARKALEQEKAVQESVLREAAAGVVEVK